jgi:hypothetical protein
VSESGEWIALAGAHQESELAEAAGLMFLSNLWTALLGVFLFGVAASAPVPEVDVAREKLRCGRVVVELADIDRARLTVSGINRNSALDLHLSASGRFRFTVPLRVGKTLVLQPITQRLLLGLLPQTSVAMPESQDDPTGKHARYNFPSHLTRDAAIEVVRNPPLPTDPLPIPW